jgi:hypothetical protein
VAAPLAWTQANCYTEYPDEVRSGDPGINSMDAIVGF